MHYNLGVLLMKEGNVDGAIASFERALTLNPSYAQAHNNLGVALMDGKDDVARATRHFQAATQADPGYADAWFNLGLAQFRAGDNVRATNSFERALSLQPKASGPTPSSASCT